MISGLLFFLLLITPLVFLHELGHYLAARACGVKVEAFSVGFGKVLWQRTWRGTEWRISALPLGGYVKIAGEQMEEGEAPEPDSLFAKSPLERAFIAFAGPAVNLILPILVLMVFLMGRGHTYTLPIIGSVNVGSAAMKAGLKEGDRILEIDGEVIKSWNDLSGHIAPAAGRSINLVVRRGSRLKRIVAEPDSRLVPDPLGGQTRRGMLGISANPRGPVVLTTTDCGLKDYDEVFEVDGKAIGSFTELWRGLRGNRHLLKVRRYPPRKAGEPLDQAAAETLEVTWIRPMDGTLGFVYPELTVEGVKEGSSAAEQGLQAGDRIESAGGLSIRTWSELNQVLENSEDMTAKVRVRRGKEARTVSLSLKKRMVSAELRTEREIFEHGIITSSFIRSPQMETETLGVFSATAMATVQCYNFVSTMVEGLRRMVTGSVPLSQIGGPLMLYDIGKEASRSWDQFWWWFLLLSLNLGLMNLLPIPVLDGGLIMISLVEMIRRRPLSWEARVKANQVGLVLVLGLMGLAIINDVFRFLS